MATKTPTRRKFRSAWDELDYLYHKILHWYYEKGDRGRALAYSARFETLLRKHAATHEAIFGEGCWSLLFELKGNLAKAIRHREREIELIHQLWEVSRDTPGAEFALTGYALEDLCDRLELLSLLYHDVGNLDRAIVLLVESKRLSESVGLPFSGENLLREYMDERDPLLARVLQTQSQH
jgi:tetratricopeptide (TPR) repeat protein